METDVSSGYVRVSKRMFPRPILCPILPPMTRQALPPMTDDRQPEPFGFGFGTGTGRVRNRSRAPICSGSVPTGPQLTTRNPF